MSCPRIWYINKPYCLKLSIFFFSMLLLLYSCFLCILTRFINIRHNPYFQKGRFEANLTILFGLLFLIQLMRCHDISAPYFQRFHLPPPVNKSNNISKAIYFSSWVLFAVWGMHMLVRCVTAVKGQTDTPALKHSRTSVCYTNIWRDFTIRCCFMPPSAGTII